MIGNRKPETVLHITMGINLIDYSEPEFLAPFICEADSSLLTRFWESLSEQEDFYLAKWRQHYLTPLLYWQILRQGWSGAFSRKLLEVLRKDFASALQAASRQEEEVRELLRAFQQAGIEVILLKGVDLRQRVYGDPALRIMSDIDLMIAKDSLTKAKEILVELGYSLEYSMESCYSKLKNKFSYYCKFDPPAEMILSLDLHWELYSLALLNRIPYEILNDSAQIIHYEGIPVKVLSPEHLVIHVSLHALDHSLDFPEDFSDLGQKVVDLAGILAKLPIDWPRFLSEVDRFHCNSQIYPVLQEFSTLAKGKIPQWVLDHLRDHPRSLAEKVLWNLQKSIHSCLDRISFTQKPRVVWEKASIFFSFFRSRL